MKASLRVNLYLAGDSPNSLAAAANLRQVLAQFPESGVEVEFVNVLVDPERGLRDGVLISPMLVKWEPAPERRLLGNLNDRAALLRVLGLVQAAHG